MSTADERRAIVDCKRKLRELNDEAADVIIHLAKYSPNPSVRFQAARTILEYNLGKPAQTIDVDVYRQFDNLPTSHIMEIMRQRLAVWDQQKLIEGALNGSIETRGSGPAEAGHSDAAVDPEGEA